MRSDERAVQRATPFTRTFQRLLADRSGPAIIAAVAGALVVVAWCWWAGHARLALYETSLSARVELDASTYLVQSPETRVIATGRLRVVAQFPPYAALGRIRVAQTGFLHLDGFPSSEFGLVTTTVAHVAREPRDGAVRVELAIDPHSNFRGPLEHGMPGSLNIAVDRVTPLALLMRAVSQALVSP